MSVLSFCCLNKFFPSGGRDEPEFLNMTSDKLYVVRNAQLTKRIDSRKGTPQEKVLRKTNSEVRLGLCRSIHMIEDQIRAVSAGPVPQANMKANLLDVWQSLKEQCGVLEMSIRYNADKVYKIVSEDLTDDGVPASQKKKWIKLKKEEEKEDESRKAKKRKKELEYSSSEDSSSDSGSDSSDSSSSEDSGDDRKKKRKKRDYEKSKRKKKDKRKKRKKDKQEQPVQVLFFLQFRFIAKFYFNLTLSTYKVYYGMASIVPYQFY